MTPHLAKPTLAPSDALAAWPQDRPLAAMLAGDPTGPTRFSIFTEPTHTVALDTLDELDTLLACAMPADPAAPFAPGWIGWIDYAAGRRIEPSAQHGDRCIHRPAAVLSRVDAGWIHDNRPNSGADPWTTLGNPDGALPPIAHHASFTLGALRGLDRQRAFEDAVARVVDLIHAGDAFQVNLTHRLFADFAGSPRALAAELADRLAPWHGAFIEHAGVAVASASPELFLRVTPDRRVVTRPMKGTRPAGDRSLEASPKDAAELAMIVDLMRNDLGRVCEFGSVRVDEARAIERHGPARAAHVEQGVATISGTLRTDRTIADLIRATFPPGSVTGAPKVRAMQIIDELEPDLGFDDAMPARGPYCGAIGYFGDDGSVSLAVGIRTAIMQNGTCHYPVGAGIVADSNPADEWMETLVKARPFIELCRGASA